MNADSFTLTSLDWIVIIIYGIGMLVVGFYFSYINKSTDDYMLGGRNMKSWRVGLSLFATMYPDAINSIIMYAIRAVWNSIAPPKVCTAIEL